MGSTPNHFVKPKRSLGEFVSHVYVFKWPKFRFLWCLKEFAHRIRPERSTLSTEQIFMTCLETFEKIHLIITRQHYANISG